MKILKNSKIIKIGAENMRIFDMFKKKEKEKNSIDIESFMAAMMQMVINEVEYMEPLLKMNKINCEFENLIASTFAYYFSVWLAYIEKNAPESYNKIKEKMEYAANGIITDTCNGNNASKDKYIEIFNVNFDNAIQEARSSISDETFYDKGITVKYLISMIEMQDISNIKTQVQVRILQYWVKAASEGIKKIKFI